VTENPYLKKRNAHKIGRAGRASETSLTKKIGGRQTPGSGAVKGCKGDIQIGSFLLEAKSTTNDSFSLKREMLMKIAGEAIQQNKHPALTVSFVNESGKPKTGESEWVLIPLKQFEKFRYFIEQESEI